MTSYLSQHSAGVCNCRTVPPLMEPAQKSHTASTVSSRRDSNPSDAVAPPASATLTAVSAAAGTDASSDISSTMTVSKIEVRDTDTSSPIQPAGITQSGVPFVITSVTGRGPINSPHCSPSTDENYQMVQQQSVKQSSSSSSIADCSSEPAEDEHYGESPNAAGRSSITVNWESVGNHTSAGPAAFMSPGAVSDNARPAVRPLQDAAAEATMVASEATGATTNAGQTVSIMQQQPASETKHRSQQPAVYYASDGGSSVGTVSLASDRSHLHEGEHDDSDVSLLLSHALVLSTGAMYCMHVPHKPEVCRHLCPQQADGNAAAVC